MLLLALVGNYLYNDQEVLNHISQLVVPTRQALVVSDHRSCHICAGYLFALVVVLGNQASPNPEAGSCFCPLNVFHDRVVTLQGLAGPVVADMEKQVEPKHHQKVELEGSLPILVPV